MSSPPASYFTLEQGTPVVDRFGQPVGKIRRVLLAFGQYFDGVVVATREGDRFVDAPEVRRIANDEVELGVVLADVLHPGPEDPTGPRGVHAVRRDRVDATDDDRSAAVAQLKLAFIADRVGIPGLERRVELVHRATTLAELDDILAAVR